jgi:hypothetical protein
MIKIHLHFLQCPANCKIPLPYPPPSNICAIVIVIYHATS